jgi:hypothetical protein
VLQSQTAKVCISHISATNFFETELSPETDSAGLKTSKTAFNLIFPQLLGDHQNFRSYHQYCIPDLGTVAEEFSGMVSCGKKVITSRISGPDKYRRVVLVVRWGVFSPIVGI